MKLKSGFPASFFRRLFNLCRLLLLLLSSASFVNAQPEFSAEEMRALNHRKSFSDAVRHKLPHDEFPLADSAALKNSAATAGNIDSTFNAAVTESFGYVNETLVQPDGKIVVVGLFQRANGRRTNGIARFNADGSFDATFNIGTGANAVVRAVALQPDGKFIVGGAFTSFNGQAVNRIVRLNTDGSIDGSFSLSTAFNGQINDILISPDGKIFVGGVFSLSSSRLVRLNADGTLDAALAGFNGTVVTIVSAPGGKILIGGEFTRRIVRLNADGTNDATFNTGTGPNNPVYRIVVQPDGKILVGGAMTTFNGSVVDQLIRLNENGTLENTFKVVSDPQAIDLEVNALAVQPDGKIVVGFYYFSPTMNEVSGIARFNGNGTADATFASNETHSSFISDLKILADGKILVGGGFTSFNYQQRLRLLQLNSDGTLYNAFSPTVSTIGVVSAIKRQADGKIIIGGDFKFVNGIPKSGLARLNADGTVDSAFNVGEGFSGYVYSLLVLPDGKIIVGGLFNEYGGAQVYGVVRINQNGGLDSNLNFENRLVIVGYALALQPDGKILVGGQIYNNTQSGFVMASRINQNGSLDTTFTPPALPNGTVRAIAVQPSGKIIVGGTFFNQGTFNKNGLARLNNNGSLDNEFTAGAGQVHALAQQADGKIVSGGIILTRFLADGAGDSTFRAGSNVDNLVRAVEIQPDGRILFGGQFSTYNGTIVNRIARVNPDGSLDSTFNSGTSGNVLSIIAQPDGKLLIGGQFADYNGVEKFSLVRLQSSAAPTKTLYDFDGDGKSDVSVFRPSNGVWYVQRSQSGFSAAQFGVSNDLIAPADFDGDGKTDTAVFRPSNGTWYYVKSSDNQFSAVAFGQNGDVPRPGDFDGDGRADFAVFRPSNGTWYILRSQTGFTAIAFGQSGDVPLIADFDGDGKSDVAVFRPSNGTWYRLNSSNNSFSAVGFGASSDLPAPADFDGDGKTDTAVFRPSNGTWYIQRSRDGFTAVAFGQNGDAPTVGDFDGDGKADFSVFRPETGVWYFLNSRAGFNAAGFGRRDDEPIPAAFIR